ncbi:MULTISPECIES: multiprotein bridging factor aMBF1 [unclassified Haladaptatus]|uniref:multiprotein bridging factor aMBF1 n=1 Tax=unclassified Haladaptatus TaxID=2622732 RepID=UPI00209C27CA|nr:MULTISPECIES: multiprotein bridging factor aMBF1 [unclassified Haladaptatus]MCO8245882.1 multiprotein bridging factor aMBF1 [Haladaptatus sp. AB643]MCO8254498.1 multiprotein bridging factor aMBF1 [Haladaptatus sp. AB618]
MVQCEMCGAETASPKTIKVEGAELDVCDNCSDFGTEVKTQQTSTTSTKYSTSSSSSGDSSTGTGSTGSSGGRSRRHDMFDDMEEIAQDYDDRIRNARESTGLSQEELAKELNEKASLISKLEHGDILPSDSVQKKLEKKLDISLTAGSSGADDEEWSGGSSTGSYTLGDVVKRKD